MTLTASIRIIALICLCIQTAWNMADTSWHEKAIETKSRKTSLNFCLVDELDCQCDLFCFKFATSSSASTKLRCAAPSPDYLLQTSSYNSHFFFCDISKVCLKLNWQLNGNTANGTMFKKYIYIYLLLNPVCLYLCAGLLCVNRPKHKSWLQAVIKTAEGITRGSPDVCVCVCLCQCVCSRMLINAVNVAMN